MQPTSRHFQLQQLAAQTFDLLVIGGGITGAGIALDASLRGLSVLLLEKADFAAGTSSRSTKLIHGGLRYLKQMELGLVRETGRERAVVHRLAPHLVVPEKMLLPITRNGSYSRMLASFGLRFYDSLANVAPEDRRKMLSKAETMRREPLLSEKQLTSGGLYAEYRTDDARLTIEILKTAAANGAICLNYAEVRSLSTEKGKVTGVNVANILAATPYEVLNSMVQLRAKVVINATGPWVDHIRSLEGPIQGKHLRLSKGVHIVVPHSRLPVSQSLYFDVADKRMVFAIPRGKTTYIGTTDTPYDGHPDEVATEAADIAYLLSAANHAFPGANLVHQDVIAAWAGVRPLIAQPGKDQTAELSRKEEIMVSKSGLISIAGGKLTGYRKMAERVVDRAIKQGKLRRKAAPCTTENTPLLCSNSLPDTSAVESLVTATAVRLAREGVNEAEARRLVHLYGSNTEAVLRFLPQVGEGHIRSRILMCELLYSLENEWVVKPEDFWVRRSGVAYFEPELVAKYNDLVLGYMARHFGWNQEQQQRFRYVQPVLPAPVPDPDVLAAFVSES